MRLKIDLDGCICSAQRVSRDRVGVRVRVEGQRASPVVVVVLLAAVIVVLLLLGPYSLQIFVAAFVFDVQQNSTNVDEFQLCTLQS